MAGFPNVALEVSEAGVKTWPGVWRRWRERNAPTSILPWEWPAESDADRAADAVWTLQHGERDAIEAGLSKADRAIMGPYLDATLPDDDSSRETPIVAPPAPGAVSPIPEAPAPPPTPAPTKAPGKHKARGCPPPLTGVVALIHTFFPRAGRAFMERPTFSELFPDLLDDDDDEPGTPPPDTEDIPPGPERDIAEYEDLLDRDDD